MYKKFLKKFKEYPICTIKLDTCMSRIIVVAFNYNDSVSYYCSFQFAFNVMSIKINGGVFL